MFGVQPLHPSANPLLQYQQDTKLYQQHRQRLKKVTATIDSKPPPVAPHVVLKLKKLQIESDRLKEVDAENQRLLNKLVQISGSDGKNFENTHYDYRSLNKNSRQARSLNIVKENERIVNRLVHLKPTYNRRKSVREWKEREELGERISRYRHPWKRSRSLPSVRRSPSSDADQAAAH